MLTPDAAAELRRIVHGQKLDPARIRLHVRRNPDGDFALDLSENEFAGSEYAGATSNGIPIVVPRSQAALLHDLTIHYDGGFIFNGSAVSPTVASDPGSVTLSRRKLGAISPQLNRDAAEVKRLSHILRNGDSRAALVISTSPIVIAAYTDELDDVALLTFPANSAETHPIEPGMRMLTVNVYNRAGDYAGDLVRGERDCGRYKNFLPHIAEFLSDDMERIEQRKQEIDDDEWNRTGQLAIRAMKRAKGRYRNGCPPHNETPAY